MTKVKHFFVTALLGGAVAVLPLALIVVVFRWGWRIVEGYLKPLVELFDTQSKIIDMGLYALFISVIVLFCFLFGLFIETRFGNLIRNAFEQRYLMKIPGYKTAREIVMQFFGSKKSFFSDVVLVDAYGVGNYMTGFVTEDQGKWLTVFMPTGPNPTSGFILHVPASRVVRTNVPVDVAIKSIISCGSGSTEVFRHIADDASELKIYTHNTETEAEKK
jgi:uncharacterized membrane protein